MLINDLIFYYGFTNKLGEFIRRHAAVYYGDHALAIRKAYDIPLSVSVIYKEG